ncbi:unnamed protein product, partial [Brassica rapa subsp. narinosa]
PLLSIKVYTQLNTSYKGLLNQITTIETISYDRISHSHTSKDQAHTLRSILL